MARQIQRVKHTRPCPPALPKDVWQERVFIEAETGEEFVVVYSGMRMPSDCWPEGTSVKGERMPAHGHSHRPRQTT